MNMRQVLWIMVLSSVLLAAGCAPTTRGGYYGYPSSRTYDPYYGSPVDPYDSRPYYGGSYGSYDEPYYDPYRSHEQEHRSLEREHHEQHENLERKYDKAMNRLNRQELQAQEKLNRKYGGNPADPRYQERSNKIQQKYNYKREELEREHEDSHGW